MLRPICRYFFLCVHSQQFSFILSVLSQDTLGSFCPIISVWFVVLDHRRSLVRESTSRGNSGTCLLAISRSASMEAGFEYLIEKLGGCSCYHRSFRSCTPRFKIPNCEHWREIYNQSWPSVSTLQYLAVVSLRHQAKVPHQGFGESVAVSYFSEDDGGKLF